MVTGGWKSLEITNNIRKKISRMSRECRAYLQVEAEAAQPFDGGRSSV